MSEITIEVWLYGPLAHYGGPNAQESFSQLQVHLPPGSTMGDLLGYLGLPTEERGITFINGKLSAMPGIQPDLGEVLSDADRVGLFHTKSMWPFQYRHGAMVTPKMAQAMASTSGQGLHHSYDKR